MQSNIDQTPHLKTALTGPLNFLEKQFLNKQQEIETWLQLQWQKYPAPVYGSVDLRNAGFKLAPVDMNLFPAGFNNLSLNPAFLPLSIRAAKIAIHQFAPAAKHILLIPEDHTRNVFYWENIRALCEILLGAGFLVRVGSLFPDAEEIRTITLNNGEKIIVEAITRERDLMKVSDFIPDVILLNNDLSAGVPDILKNLSQPVLPSVKLGWSQRLKSEHFNFYAQESQQFAELVEIDPWLITPLFQRCDGVDFMRREGEECLISSVEKLLTAVQKKYAEYKIPYPPYIVVKANAGTYGMAVMMVKNADELRSLNRKQRTSMAKSKGGQTVQSVIIQEGVHSFETWGIDNAVAEPVVYLWGQRVVGGFYRVHKERGIDENLNSPGMQFEPLPFAKTCDPPPNAAPGECQNRFYAYGVIARLSMLAAAREMA